MASHSNTAIQKQSGYTGALSCNETRSKTLQIRHPLDEGNSIGFASSRERVEKSEQQDNETYGRGLQEEVNLWDKMINKSNRDYQIPF